MASNDDEIEDLGTELEKVELEKKEESRISSEELRQNCDNNRDEFREKTHEIQSEKDRRINSIVVSDKDNHLFLADFSNGLILEMKESGEIVSKFILEDKKEKKFYPHEMTFISSEILVVNCRSKKWIEKKIFLLERTSVFPFFLRKETINTKDQTFSVCQMKNQILMCDFKKFEIDFYTEKERYIKTTKVDELAGNWSSHIPLIRADPSTGNFWGAITNTCKIFCFNEDGKKLQSFEIKEKIEDFSLNQFGQIFFSNLKGIFKFSPKMNLCENLHKFENKSEKLTKIFVTRKKIFVCLQINKKYLIKIFKFLD